MEDRTLRDGRSGFSMREQTPTPNLLAQACALAAAALGLGALLGWLLDLPQLTRLAPKWMPMAPSAALSFALFGTTLFFCARLPGSRAVRRTAMGIALAVGLFAALLLLLYWSDIRAEIEHLGFTATRSAGGAHVGHMSPVSAACFLFAAASLFASLPAARRTIST